MVIGSGFGAKPSHKFTEDDTRSYQTFGVVVVRGDPVREIQECQEFVSVFEQAFTEAPDFAMGPIVFSSHFVASVLAPVDVLAIERDFGV